MTLDEVKEIDWFGPWEPIDEEQAAALEAELHREASPKHDLFGCRVTAIAIGGHGDDVLFYVHGLPPRLAVVHLTWNRAPEPWPALPDTSLFDSIDEFVLDCLCRDAKGWY
jgi:hypothetical protein